MTVKTIYNIINDIYILKCCDDEQPIAAFLNNLYFAFDLAIPACLGAY